MKKLKLNLILLLALTHITSYANEDLADTVNSFMVEGYNNILNINVLSEICAIEQYLIVNTQSNAYQKKLSDNIKRFAKLAKVKKYDTKQVENLVTQKFKAFSQGVRYGGFIADSFAKGQQKKDLCTDKVRKNVAISIRDLIKQEEFSLD